MENLNVAIPQRKKRNFLPEDYQLTDWDNLKDYYENLLKRNIETKVELKVWLKDKSELESMISEDSAWRYIRMTCNTEDKDVLQRYQYFISQIEPQIAPYAHKLNLKLLQSPALDQIKDESGFDILIKQVEKEIRIFREENIPLQTEIQSESQKFGAISGAMSVEVQGKELTMPQAGALLEEPDRHLRQEVYLKIQQRRQEDKSKLDALFDHLIQLRHQVAENADFQNFRDYMFTALGRLDYSSEDCKQFHDSIKKAVVPILNDLARERKNALKVDLLKPWDKAVDPTGLPALKPFKSTDELIEKTITCFQRLDPFLGECLLIMKQMGNLDLASRKAKAPGGYNYPLAEIGVPFIFMNATSTLRDLVTIIHEGGHAVHSFLMKDLELNDFRQTPSEVAELASMSMELISMDHWDLFFQKEEDLKRAKREHLEQVIQTLPWVATIDKFQHWLYENPDHTDRQRAENWSGIFEDFADKVADWTGLEEFKAYSWQKQLHLFEVPFYYIEYAMAQLGAIAIWKNYKENPEQGIAGYMKALKLGYTVSIPEVYRAAGIRFDFSEEYIRELMQFVQVELAALH